MGRTCRSSQTRPDASSGRQRPCPARHRPDRGPRPRHHRRVDQREGVDLRGQGLPRRRRHVRTPSKRHQYQPKLSTRQKAVNKTHARIRARGRTSRRDPQDLEDPDQTALQPVTSNDRHIPVAQHDLGWRTRQRTHPVGGRRRRRKSRRPCPPHPHPHPGD
jgi:hypothetical protein